MNTASTTSSRVTALLVLGGIVSGFGDGCSKSRADEFSRFQASAAVQSAGKGPLKTLRYRATAGQEVLYQLVASRRSPELRASAKMRLRVAFGFPTAGPSGAFRIRLLSILRLDPPPPGGPTEPDPTQVLLQGMLGPRGQLSEVSSDGDLPSPVNLALLAPLLLPPLPKAAVGAGARWRDARRHTWRRQRSGDSLTSQTGFDSTSELLLRGTYHFEKIRTHVAVVTGDITAKLRNRTRTLGHTAAQHGSAKATARYELELATGLPELVQLTLNGSYQLKTDDQSRKVTEVIQVRLIRER